MNLADAVTLLESTYNTKVYAIEYEDGSGTTFIVKIDGEKAFIRIKNGMICDKKTLDQGGGTIRKLTKEDLKQQQRNLKQLQDENRKRHEYYTRFR